MANIISYYKIRERLNIVLNIYHGSNARQKSDKIYGNLVYIPLDQ